MTQRKKYFDDPKHNAAFERCIDVMVKMILKYGPQVLEELNKKASSAECIPAEEQSSSHRS